MCLKTWTWCSNLDCLISAADTWQTMITGFAAVVAAWFSIRAVRRQIQSSEEQERHRRLAKVAAARLRLPLQLSEIVSFSNQSIKLLKAYLDTFEQGRTAIDQLALEARPSFPEASVILFAEIVENSDHQGFSDYLTALVCEMQVLNSRINQMSYVDEIIVRPNLESYVIQAAKIRAYCDGLFPNARGQESSPPQSLDWDFLFNCLNLNDIDIHDYASLHAFAQRMKKRETAPDIQA